MPKGIVTSTPKITKPKGQVYSIGDDNGNGSGWMDYANKPGEKWSVDDTVEFTIGEKECEITNKYEASQGIVSEEPKFKVKITKLESDDRGVKLDSDPIIFDSYPDEKGQFTGNPACKSGDTIEVIITSIQSCVFVKVLKEA